MGSKRIKFVSTCAIKRKAVYTSTLKKKASNLQKASSKTNRLILAENAKYIKTYVVFAHFVIYLKNFYFNLILYFYIQSIYI